MKGAERNLQAWVQAENPSKTMECSGLTGVQVPSMGPEVWWEKKFPWHVLLILPWKDLKCGDTRGRCNQLEIEKTRQVTQISTWEERVTADTLLMWIQVFTQDQVAHPWPLSKGKEGGARSGAVVRRSGCPVILKRMWTIWREGGWWVEQGVSLLYLRGIGVCNM